MEGWKSYGKWEVEGNSGIFAFHFETNGDEVLIGGNRESSETFISFFVENAHHFVLA